MKFALIFATFIAIFATQGEVLGFPQDAERGLAEDFKEAIQKLVDTINGIISEAGKQLAELVQNLQDRAQQILEKIINSVIDQIVAIVINVKELVDFAKQLDIDIKECVGDKIEEIEKIPETVGNTGRQCVQETVDKAMSIVDDTMEVINNYKGMIREFEGKWNECDRDVGCKIKLIVEATEMTIFLPGEISIQVKRTVELIKNLDDEMVVCLNKTLKSAIDEANRISAEITVCINDKIPKA